MCKQTEQVYSDSFFYNSPQFKYPTVDDQKRLAKQIASTLEGSNPATSKYHKKKSRLVEPPPADDHDNHADDDVFRYPSNDHLYNPHLYQQQQQLHERQTAFASYMNDSELPDVIKRSIARAAVNDPVRMVQAPDHFKEQHYTEHVTHTEMPPQAARSLAAALEMGGATSGLAGSTAGGGGGRGAQIFQRRKAKSSSWVVEDTSVPETSPPPPPPPPPAPIVQPYQLPSHFQSFSHLKLTQQQQQVQQQQQQKENKHQHTVVNRFAAQQQQQQQHQQQAELHQHYKLDTASGNNNDGGIGMRCADFNSRPKGWSTAAANTTHSLAPATISRSASSHGTSRNNLPTTSTRNSSSSNNNQYTFSNAADSFAGAESTGKKYLRI